MRVQPPASFFGVSSGIWRLRLSDTERATLRRAAAIFDKADDLIQVNGVDQDDYDVRGDLINGWDICSRFAADESPTWEPMP